MKGLLARYIAHAVFLTRPTRPSSCAEMATAAEDASKGMFRCRFQAESGRIRGKCDQQSCTVEECMAEIIVPALE